MARTFHKHQRNGRLTLRGIVILILGVAIMPAIYTANHHPPGPDPQPVSAAEAAQAAKPTRVNHYETPCDLRERTTRGIPAYSVDDSKGLMAYVWEHLDENYVPDAELADYWAALDACDVNEPVAKWDFDNMILVSVEYIGG
jgi:hypothetical protein